MLHPELDAAGLGERHHRACPRRCRGSALAGDPGTAPAAPCTRLGLEAITELLWLAQWNDAEALARVLSLCEHAGPLRDDTIQAVFGWLTHDDVAVVDEACAWLARRGPAACRAFAIGLDGSDTEGKYEADVTITGQNVVEKDGQKLTAGGTTRGTIRTAVGPQK